MISLPACRQRALGRIEQALAAEDPDLGLRFAFFTMLTRHEALPATEQVPGGLGQALRRAMTLPLVAISLAALLAANGLTSGQPACRTGPNAAAHSLPSLSRAARCGPGPAIKPDTMRVH